MNISKRKLFYISWIGGLTFLAGAINICAAMLFGMTITHYSGNVSNAAMALGRGELSTFTSIFSIIIIFFTGSTISGFLFHEQNSNIKKYYSILPILFGLVIIITYITHHKNIILAIFALGMGVQNGTWLKVRGVKVRTTHITGYLTDAAFCLGAVLHGYKGEAWKMMFYIASSMSFFAGGVISTVIIKMLGFQTVVVLALLYILLGIHIHIAFLLDIEHEHLPHKHVEHLC